MAQVNRERDGAEIDQDHGRACFSRIGATTKHFSKHKKRPFGIMLERSPWGREYNIPKFSELTPLCKIVRGGVNIPKLSCP